MSTMSFYEFRSEQTGSDSTEVTLTRKTKPYHSQTCFNNILRIFHHVYYSDKCPNAYKIRKSVLLN